MDYAIYKTNDGKLPRIIRRFTQKAYNHKAKRAAKDVLYEMRLRVVNRGYKADGSKDDEFSFDFPTSIRTSVQIRFYIAKL